ncbi:MAG TPA: hypothetical protein OIM60_03455 [Clostridiaceae bacterium]|jgi:hypothetical protein|nr:hypothetical protein [Clostridiaceae bacterium]
MNIEKALEITKDRIDSLKIFIPSNQSETQISIETLEYLKFIENLLENLGGSYDNSKSR